MMDKVFSCADDCDIKIYYQDTGSLHLNYGDVDKIENKYKEEHGSELLGEELGNCHIHFSMDNANTETYAIESLCLGKKTYIDILEPTDKYGKTINSEHIRMKGIPTPCINNYAEQHNVTVLDVCTKLFNNKTIYFDLTNDNTKFVSRKKRLYNIKCIRFHSEMPIHQR